MKKKMEILHLRILVNDENWWRINRFVKKMETLFFSLFALRHKATIDFSNIKGNVIPANRSKKNQLHECKG